MLPVKTIEDIRALRPCYDPVTGLDDDGVVRHAGGFLRETWQGTALDVLRVETCPAEDRLWVVLHAGWMLRDVWERFARWCALQVIQHWDAPEVVRRFLETGEDAMAAESAAWAAASAAASAESAESAESAASAARAASAAESAESAENAAWAAARAESAASAARAARAAQVEQLIKLLEACDE